MSDQFWGFVRDVTMIAGELLFFLLLETEDTKRHSKVKTVSKVFTFGDAQGECAFEYDSDTRAITLVNSSQDVLCTCTFARVTPNGVTTDYIEVPANQNREVTSYFQNYLDGGTCGLNAVTSPAGSGNVVHAATLSLNSFPLNEAAQFSFGNLVFTPQSTSLQIQNNSGQTYIINTTFAFQDDASSFAVSANVAPNASLTVPYPDAIQIPTAESIIDNLTIEITLGSLSLRRKAAFGALVGDDDAYGPIVLYSTQCMAQDLVITVLGGSSVVVSQRLNGEATQEWYFQPIFSPPLIGFQMYAQANNTNYYIKYNGNGQKLTVVNFPANDPTLVWIITRDTKSGDYYLQPSSNLGSCMDLNHGNCEQGNFVQGYGINHHANQQWHIMPS